MATVLIAGCGYVGTETAMRLLDRGHDVYAIRRDISRLPAGITGIEANLNDPETLRTLPQNVDYVLYTAAAGEYNETRYRAAYVDGPRTLLKALTELGAAPHRVLFTSSTAVYAQDSGAWVDEDSPTEPIHFSGIAMLEGERVFLDGPFAATVVRFGGIYGPDRIGTIDKVRNGAVRLPAIPTYVNLIHRDDCAGILVHLTELDDPEPVYLGVDNAPAERGAMYCWLAQRMGIDPPQAAEEDAVQDGRSGRSNKRCSNQKLRATGYTFSYPTYKEGFGALLSDALRST